MLQTKYKQFILEDVKLRSYIEKKYESAGIQNILIQRPTQSLQVRIICARPGVIIGRRGSDIDKLRNDISNLMGMSAHVNMKSIRNRIYQLN